MPDSTRPGGAVNATRLINVLELTLSAPNGVEPILDGQQPEGMTMQGALDPPLRLIRTE